MNKLIFLGTGHALTYHCYTTSIALTDDTQYFITDGGGGNGILLQLERAHIDPADIQHIFISHRHTDHLIGLIWLVRIIGHQFDRSGRTTPLHLYGEASVLSIFREVCELLIQGRVIEHFDKDILFHAVKNNETCAIGPWSITFFDIGAVKTIQYGWRAILEDGKSVVFLGDEPLSDQGLSNAKNADYLIHEAMCLESDAPLYHPHRIHHSTVVDAAHNAMRANAKHLILFHCDDHHLTSRKAQFCAEARVHFDGPVDTPNDLDEIIL